LATAPNLTASILPPKQAINQGTHIFNPATSTKGGHPPPHHLKPNNFSFNFQARAFLNDFEVYFVAVLLFETLEDGK
jgi:hypothetical protein